MDLADRDNRILLLKKEKKDRENLLRANYNELMSGVSDNPLLEPILGNYEKYQDNIIIEKQQQLDALTKLYDYLLDAPDNICKKDLAAIRHEMNKINKFIENY